MLLALKDIASAFKPLDSPEAVGLKSPLLNGIIYALPTIKEAVDKLLAAIDIKKAKGDEKEDLWIDPAKFQSIDDTKTVGNACFCAGAHPHPVHTLKLIQATEAELEEHLRKEGKHSYCDH